MLNKNELLSLHLNKSPNLSWLDNGLLFLTQHGSRVYNCNIDTSDYDYKGIVCPPKQYFFGFKDRFEQSQLKSENNEEMDDELGDELPDSVLFDVVKWFRLAVTSANPNFMEMLHADPKFHLFVSPVWEKVLEHKDKFLSLKLRHSMGGFAWSNFQRVLRHRSWLLNPIHERPSRASFGLPDRPEIGDDNLKAAMAAVNKEFDKFNFNFLHNLTKDERYAVKNAMEQMLCDAKLYVDDKFQMCAQKIGLSDNLIEILLKEREYGSKVKEFEKYQHWLKHRNPKRFEDEKKYQFDLKFAYHVIRLQSCCLELIETGKLNVFRPNRDELMEIRQGLWSFDKFHENVLANEEKLTKAYQNCKILPHGPDIDFLDDLCQEIVKEQLAHPHLTHWETSWQAKKRKERAEEALRILAMPWAVCALIRHPTDPNLFLGVSRGKDITKWGLPAGKVEEGESPEQAVTREVKEETNLDFIPEEIIFEAEGRTCYSYCFKGTISGEIKSSEEGEVAWVTREQLCQGPFGKFNSQLFAKIDSQSVDSP